MGRGGGCWGGVRCPEPSDLSFWLLVLNCWRWQPQAQWLRDWPAVGAGRGAGSRASRPPAALPPVVGLSWRAWGVRDPKHPFAQMGQSKQDGVKLSVEQPALIYIKASVFKNRNKIPLPSPAFAIPLPCSCGWFAPSSCFGAWASTQHGGGGACRAGG